MKQTEFVKTNGQIADVGALHAWVDRNTKYLQNGRYTLQIVGKRRNRTVAQNRLMWLWFACIEQETAQPSQDIHDYYTLKYLRREVVNPSTGETLIVGGHTSRLSVEQFTRFLNEVQADAAAELGITLPNPDDEAFEAFEDQYKPYVT